jgi:hypothetical protein
VIELRLDPEQLSSRVSVADLRAGTPAGKPQASPGPPSAARVPERRI